MTTRIGVFACVEASALIPKNRAMHSRRSAHHSTLTLPTIQQCPASCNSVIPAQPSQDRAAHLSRFCSLPSDLPRPTGACGARHRGIDWKGKLGVSFALDCRAWLCGYGGFDWTTIGRIIAMESVLVRALALSKTFSSKRNSCAHCHCWTKCRAD